MNKSSTPARRLVRRLAVLVLAGAIASCGGDGNEGANPAPPVVADLPAAVSITGPAQAETGAPVRWQSSLGTVQPGWTVQWNFGDDTVSTEAEPSHAFRHAGDYTVRFTVSRSGSDSRTASASVQVRATALTAGLNCSGPGSSAWCWQRPQPFAIDLSAAALIDRQTTVAVGPGNAIVATRNGGNDWSLLTAPAAPPLPPNTTAAAANRLDIVRFADTQVGVATASYPGRVLRTVDGGATWSATAEVPMFWIRAVWMLDRQTIVLTGFRAYDRFGYGLRFADLSLVSSDGGQTWREAALLVTNVTTDRTLWTVEAFPGYGADRISVSRDLGLTAVDASPCCLSSPLFELRAGLPEDSDQLLWSQAQQSSLAVPVQQRLHRSTDAGRSWSTVNVQPPGGDLSLRLEAAGHVSASEVWATFQQTTFNAQGERRTLWQRASSRDGGATWSAVGASIEGNSRLFRMDSRGWALAGDSAELRWFEDGDSNLKTLRLPESAQELRVLRRRDGVLLAGFGDPHRWALSSDQGATWKSLPGSQPGPAPGAISGLWFFDTQRGLASSSDGGFLATDNGGRTWTAQASGPDRTWANLHFTSDGTGWALAADGLRRSIDRGLNWSTISLPGATPRVLHAVDARQAWVLVSVCTDANNPASCSTQWQATRDGGVNWVRVPVPDGVVRLHFTSSTDGIAFAGSRVHVTSDGGQTWTESAFAAPTLALKQIRFVDTRRGWMLFSGVVGPRGGNASGLLLTRDGGRSWSASALPGALVLEDMAFADPMNGWIVGGNGTILATRDGGEHWELQKSGTPRGLRVVAAFDAFTAWVGGERGSLLATGAGGR